MTLVLIIIALVIIGGFFYFLFGKKRGKSEVKSEARMINNQASNEMPMTNENEEEKPQMPQTPPTTPIV